MMSVRQGGGKAVKRPKSARSKAAVAKASQSLVGLTSYDVPLDMAGGHKYHSVPSFKFVSRGFVLETKLSDDDPDTYISTVIAPAKLFSRTNGILPLNVKFDVWCVDGKAYKRKLVACDFHYNLAVITIETDAPLQPAILKDLDDVSSLDTDIILLSCSFSPPFSVDATLGVFFASHPRPNSCKELYWVRCEGINKTNSGTVINLSGEVMGVVFHNSSFLPSNFITRWWNYFKSTGNFYRPWVGVGLINLVDARLNFLEKIRNTSSDINTGVIVTKVEKNSPAYCSGIRLKDVIIKCGGKQVQSKIQFFETIWDNGGKSVELTILRASVNRLLNLSISIKKTPPTNRYRWKRPTVLTC